jgi:hypothetical protein
MANIIQQIQGVLDIRNVQGNYLLVPLLFTDDDDNPIDLSAFERIRLEIKERFNVNLQAFLTFEVGSGLTIAGEHNNILHFELDEKFWQNQIKDWILDITFQRDGKSSTWIKGTISNSLTASKI